MTSNTSLTDAHSWDKIPDVQKIIDTVSRGKMSVKTAISHLKAIPRHDLSPHILYEAISHIVIEYLITTGRLIRTEDNLYFFNSNDKQLYALDEFGFGCYMNDVFGLNQTMQDFKFVLAQVQTEAEIRGDETEVHSFTYYDKVMNTLYIDRFDGQVYRLNGCTIDCIDNGSDGVLFRHNPAWSPYKISDESPDLPLLASCLFDNINFTSQGSTLSTREQRLSVNLWTLSTFFESLQPTKPLLLLTGEKGSGKTSICRSLLRLFFGPKSDVFTLEKDKEDAFIAAITNYSIIVIDNVDGNVPWLNNRLATVATGGLIERRKLYSTNKLVTYHSKCFVALTSREPTFQREDVADRLIILTVERLETFIPEEEILARIDRNRDQLWTELIHDLNDIVAILKNRPSRYASKFRMADWASLCTIIADSQGVGDQFQKVLVKLSQQQSAFTLEDDPMFICLQYWMDDQRNHGRTVSTSELYDELKTIATGTSDSDTYDSWTTCSPKPNCKWPYDSVQSFGMRLKNILSNLQDFYEIDRSKSLGGRTSYCFNVKNRVSSLTD